MRSVLQPAIEQGGSFLGFQQSNPRSECRGSIPLMSITFDPRDSLHCWYDLSFGFVFLCQNHPGLSTLGVCSRLWTLQRVCRTKTCVWETTGDFFFFKFIFVHSTETYNYTLTPGQRHTCRKCTYGAHSHCSVYLALQEIKDPQWVHFFPLFQVSLSNCLKYNLGWICFFLFVCLIDCFTFVRVINI